MGLHYNANKLRYLVFCIATTLITSLHAKISMRGKTSSIQVASGATFNVENPIAFFDGTFIKSSGAIVTGSPITFSNDISQSVSALNNNLINFQGVLRQLISIQTKADLSSGIFLRTYDTQTIPITGTTYFSNAMLPLANQTIVLEFPQHYDSTSIPELIFNDVGDIELPQGSRLIISGIGIIEMIGTTTFIFDGTPTPNAAISGANWSAFNIEQGAMMHLAPGASVTLGGGAASNHAGSFNLYNNATLLLDTNSTLVLGGSIGNQLMVKVDALSTIQLNNPMAQMSVCSSIFDFSFKRQSSLSINNGILELNTQKVDGVIIARPSTIRSLSFTDGSSLLVQSQGANGLLRFAPNSLDATTNFDNSKGVVLGRGQMELVTFDQDGNIDTDTLANMTGSKGLITASMEDIFMLLTT